MPENHGATDTEAQDSGSNALAVVSSGLRRGSADAVEAASKTFESAARFASRFVYTTCYTVSYGVVFPVMLVAGAIPRDNAAVRGLIEGAEDACSKADDVHRSTTEPRTELVTA